MSELKEVLYSSEDSNKKILQILPENRETMPESKEVLYSSDDEPFQSSESEYIPDTTSSASETENENSFLQFNKGKNFVKYITSKPSPKLSEFPSTSGLSQTAIGNKSEIYTKNIDGTIATFGKFVNSLPKVEHFCNTRPWTRKNTCPYCDRDVTHFARHLERNHLNEGAVKELCSLGSRNPKRKLLLKAILRQGNFTSNSKINIIRPVRRPKGEHNCEIVPNSENLKDKYIVCQSCLGYFSRNYLKRHRKKCKLRTDQSLTARQHHLSSAQMFAMCTGPNSNFYESLRLKNEVFPIMRSDDISKAAMGDVLICSYAESLLRKHRRPQIKNVISNKMRELGRLLLTLREASGCQILLDTLKPEMFDHFVAATKIISGYNEETRSFKASSLALHMGTTLKQICDMATKLLIKKTKLLPYEDSEKCLKEIKRLKKIFENHWSSEISSLALKNLNENKYEKPKLMPLTTDIMKFNNYVSRQA
ncbi:uncharacterized protein LOC126749510 [Anthonomus grandis grandis]|uniref:uncharacterized protein LOC126749510 n=1 Tax=Anthonomus grandis grandis TaxID=2921223 RepID=UPI002165CE23|nr:uncharacterized protein LOC126749510 [Anthonomus grandis grandis]